MLLIVLYIRRSDAVDFVDNHASSYVIIVLLASDFDLLLNHHRLSLVGIHQLWLLHRLVHLLHLRLLHGQVHLLLGLLHGRVHLLLGLLHDRVHLLLGHLGLFLLIALELISFPRLFRLIFVVLDLLLQSVYDNLADDNINSNSNRNLDAHENVCIGLKLITVCVKVVAIVNGLNRHNKDDIPHDYEGQ